MKLFLKGERCYTEKCAIEKRNFPPGQHGKDRKPKIVGYGTAAARKAEGRRYYQLLENQFRNLFEKAATMKGITGDNMLSLLERRLDNVDVPHRLRHLALHRARQLVRHGHIERQRPPRGHPFLHRQARRRDHGTRKLKENPTILHARDATAHAPAPTGWKWIAKTLRPKFSLLPSAKTWSRFS